MILELSTLNKTWLFDVDGTIIYHNSVLTTENILPGVKKFWDCISDNDVIIILTARPANQKDEIEEFLRNNNLRFDNVICSLPVGERIVVNDIKPNGLKTAVALNIQRNCGFEKIEIKKCII